MPAGLVFVTGVSRFVGYATALERLQPGNRLRLSIPWIKAASSSYSASLESVIIPDITKRDAFSGHLVGVDYVLHVASPLRKGTSKADYFPGAINLTTAIPSKVAKVASIQRICHLFRCVFDMHPFPPAAMLLYQVSKMLALQATKAIVSAHKPGFDMCAEHGLSFKPRALDDIVGQIVDYQLRLFKNPTI
ncbi:hypothetical protein N7508_003878 [Penicillium antarcticum]|uniref:uncharacterized protein n=1 Tax=Penicillium antarcticum TaxID=416450 RepID=UPI002390F7F0|nr:uncharacterized protein N7508_003878 [Penicillium antarcticum]KAJ5313048.1 hypothetical protein N7508_003878 [Penicillium antarcticum]